MECCTDVGDGIACKGKCEEAVIATNKLVKRSINVSSSKASYMSPVFCFLFGVLFISYGLSSESYFLKYMGYGFVTYAVIMFFYVLRYFKT